jgi:DNA-binding transcriptional regulator YiaG
MIRDLNQELWGAWLICFRNCIEFDQRSFAKRLQVDVRTLRKWELGRTSSPSNHLKN